MLIFLADTDKCYSNVLISIEQKGETKAYIAVLVLVGIFLFIINEWVHS